METPINLPDDYREFLELCIAHKVKFLIVGGYAVAAHGYVRYTRDIDILISNEEKNAKKVSAVLQEFGFGSLGITKEDLMNDDLILQLGYPPLRIDLITSITGHVNFDKLYDNHDSLLFGENMKLPVINRVDLIENKKKSGRPRDLADADELEKE
jgi:hypothetical protein